jgi:hypothetical protein
LAEYWKDRPPQAANLRLLCIKEGWKSFADRVAKDGKTVEEIGSGSLVESALLNTLNATSLLLLAGAGASQSAANPKNKPNAPSMDDLWLAVMQAAGENGFKQVLSQFPYAAIDRNIEKLLSLCKIHLELYENAKEDDRTKALITKFIKVAEAAILKRVDFVDSDTTLDPHSEVIRKIGRRGIRKPRAKFFTTNYDLCFEEAARRQRFVIVDGFSHSLDQTFDRSHFDYDVVRRESMKETPDYLANVFHLYKLHGSVDWRRVNGEIVRSRADIGSPALIYPRSSKYQEAFEPPYLDMMGAFQAALREPDAALIVSGFGFNDDHISRPVIAAMEANLSLRLIVCDPIFVQSGEDLHAGHHVVSDSSAPNNEFLARLHALAIAGDARIHLMNGRFSDLAAALPDLIGETDRERHANRVRALRDVTGTTAQ